MWVDTRHIHGCHLDGQGLMWDIINQVISGSTNQVILSFLFLNQATFGTLHCNFMWEFGASLSSACDLSWGVQVEKLWQCLFYWNACVGYVIPQICISDQSPFMPQNRQKRSISAVKDFFMIAFPFMLQTAYTFLCFICCYASLFMLLCFKVLGSDTRYI